MRYFMFQTSDLAFRAFLQKQIPLEIDILVKYISVWGGYDAKYKNAMSFEFEKTNIKIIERALRLNNYTEGIFEIGETE